MVKPIGLMDSSKIGKDFKLQLIENFLEFLMSCNDSCTKYAWQSFLVQTITLN